MASSLLASALNKYVGTILGPVAPSNVSLEVKGCLTLTDVVILPSFLNSLRLPVHTISARAETVTIKLNPRKLRVELVVEELDLLTSTAVQCEGPEAKVELENAVLAKLQALATDEYLQLGGAPFDVWGYFGFAKFININILKAHIRVQHSGNGKDFSVGILVGHFGINSQNTSRPLSTQEGYTGLPLTMSQVSCYLNTVPTSELTLPFTGRRNMRTPFRQGFDETSLPEYMLESLTAALLLQHQSTNAKLPFLTLQLSSPAFRVLMSKSQYATLFEFLDIIFKNQAAWAAISADATKEAAGRPGTPLERSAYIGLYKATLNTDDTWLPYMAEQKAQLERGVLAEDIRAWRREAIKEVRHHLRHHGGKAKHIEPRVTLRPTINKIPFIAAGALAAVVFLLYLWNSWHGVSIGFSTPFTVFFVVLMLGSLAKGILSLFAQPPPAYVPSTGGAPIARVHLGGERFSATLVECLELTLTDAEIAYGMNLVDGGMDVTMKTSGCAITDSRKIEPLPGRELEPYQKILATYRQMLRTGPMQASYLQTSFSVPHPYRRISLNSKDFEVVMGHHSPAWVAMYFFNLPPSEAKAAEPEVKAPEPEVKTHEPAPAQPPAAAQAAMALHIEVDFVAKVKIVCGNTQSITNILELDLTTHQPICLDMLQDMSLTTTVTMAITQTRADLEQKLEQFEPINVLTPFQVKVYYRTYPSDFFAGEVGMSVDVDVETLDLTFTAETYRLLMHEVLPIVTPPPAPGTPIPEPGSPAPVVPYKAPKSYGSQSVAISTKEIRFHMLNDLLSAPSPLARALIHNVDARVHAFGHERCIFARLDMEADFYNIGIVEWEPMVEPFNAMFTMTQAIHPTRYPNPKAMYLRDAECRALENKVGFLDDAELTEFNEMIIKTDKIINLNITHAMNSRIQDVMGIVNTLFDPPGEIIDKDKPYLFENMTEFKIEVTSFEEGANKSTFGMGPYSTAPFNLRDKNPRNHKVTIEFKGMAWSPIVLEVAKVHEFTQSFSWVPPKDRRQAKPESEWQPDQDTKFCENCQAEFSFTLRRHHCRDCGLVFCSDCSKDKVNNKRCCVQCYEDYKVRMREGPVQVSWVVSVHVKNGIKHVSLHSPLGIKNETSIRLLLTSPLSPASQNWIDSPELELQAKGDIHKFEPGMIWWVPLLEAAYLSSINPPLPACAKLFLRPPDDRTKFEWCRPVVLKHPATSPSLKSFECIGKLQKMGQAEKERVDYNFTVSHVSEVKSTTRRPETCSTTYYVRDSMLVENLLPVGVNIQLMTRVHRHTGDVVGEAHIEKGKVYHSGASSMEATYIKIQLAGYEWSPLVDLKLLDNENEADRHLKAVLQKTGSKKHLIVEFEVVLQPGTIRVVVYVPYWLFDLTDLQLRFNDDHPTEEVEQEAKFADNRMATMFNFSKGKKKLFVRARTSKWCAKPICIDNTGLAGQVSLPGFSETHPDQPNGLHYEVGMIVKLAEGRYARTKIVEFAPRYVLQNSLTHEIVIHQYETQTPDSPNLFRLAAAQSEVYHSRITDPKKRPRNCALSFRRIGEEALNVFNWSGYVDIDAVGDQTVSILDRITLKSFYALILVRLEGPTIFVRFTEVKHETIVDLRYGVNYAIENRTQEQRLRIRQARDDKLDVIMAAEESIWQDIDPGKWIPYDFTEPLHLKKLQVQACLVPTPQQTEELGELKLIAYIEADPRNENEATVWIKNMSAKSLAAKDRNLLGKLTSSDPYVKLRIGPGGKKQRTTVIKSTLTPEWKNETFQFPVHVNDIPFKSLELSVWDQDTVKDEVIGYCTIPLGSIPWFVDGAMPSASHKLSPNPPDFLKFAHTLEEVDINMINPEVAKWGGGAILARRTRKLYLYVASDGPVNVLVLSDEPAHKFERYKSAELIERFQAPRKPAPFKNLMLRPALPNHLKTELNLLVIGGRNFTNSGELYCKIEFLTAVAQTDCEKPVDGALRWTKKFSTVLRVDRLQRANAKFRFTLYERHDLTTPKTLGVAQISWSDFTEAFTEAYVPFTNPSGATVGEVWLKFRRRDLSQPGAESRRGSTIPIKEDEPTTTQDHSSEPNGAENAAPQAVATDANPAETTASATATAATTSTAATATTSTAATATTSTAATVSTATATPETEAAPVVSKRPPGALRTLAEGDEDSGSPPPPLSPENTSAEGTELAPGTAVGFPAELKSEPTRVFDPDDTMDPDTEPLMLHTQISVLHIDGLQACLGEMFQHIQCEGVVEIANSPGVHRIAAFLIKDDNGIVDFKEWERKIDIFIPKKILENAAIPQHVKIVLWIEKESYQRQEVNEEHQLFEDIKFPFRLGEIDVDLADVPLEDYTDELLKIELEKSTPSKLKMEEELKEKKHQVELWKQGKVIALENVTRVDEDSKANPRLTVRVVKQECRPYNKRPFQKITIDVDGLGASLIDGLPQEIAYFTLNKAYAVLEDALDQKTMEAKIGRLQLDNQYEDAIFDVVLAPTAVPVAQRQPTIQFSSILLKEPGPVVMYHDFSVLIQKLDVKVEEMLLWKLLNYMNQFYSNADVDVPSERSASEAVKIPPIMNGANETLFFRLLELQPIAIDLSFNMASPDDRSGGQGGAAGPVGMFLTTVLSAFTAFAGSIADAPLRLNAKICKGVKGDRAYLTQLFMSHYINQAIMETYKLLGSFEFLGNPVGFANNMSEGMTDFFYEPAQGLMKSPQDFGKGLAKGSTSLLTHTLGGVFGMASTFTGAVGNFGAALSMDDDFIKSRAARSGGGPKHAVSGITDGAKSLGTGIIGGVKGVVLDPLKGAQEGGGMGLVKGVGKGLVGLAVKPTVGIIDGVSSALKGIGNTADYLLNEQCVNKRVRRQRYMPDGMLLRYADAEKKRPPPPKQTKMQQALAAI